LEETTNEEKANSKAQESFTEEGQKLIYNTSAPHYHLLRYQVLAAVFGLYTFYLLYRGDARYRTILFVPAVAGLGFLMHK
jgi:hypothetical protein